MCLAIPLRLISIDSPGTGTVALDDGTLSVGLDLVPEARIGDFLLVHAGMAIELLDATDAAEMLGDIEAYASAPAALAPDGAIRHG